MLQVLTCTGGRPQAWALCRSYMARQDIVGPVRWIIVDDGPEPSEDPLPRKDWRITIVRPRPLWKPGQNTQARNMSAGLELVDDAHPLAIVEDDDYYPPYWLRTVAGALSEGWELVGQDHARKYNLQTGRHRDYPNVDRACLCSSGAQGEGVQVMRKMFAAGIRLVDMALWREPLRKRQIAGCHVIGLKGMPGREGIDSGHRPNFGNADDPDGRVLRNWLGADAGPYLKIRGME